MVKTSRVPCIFFFYFFVLFFLISFSLYAQNNLQGNVLNAETNLPVQTFTVRTDSTDYHFTDGTFKLKASHFPVYISIIADDFVPVSLRVPASTNQLTIRLIPENVNIQEVIVKAFNSDKRLRDTPGAIELITNSQLVTEPTFTLAPIVNNLPGIWMQSGSINTNRLTIRGIGSRSPYGSNKIRAYYGDIPLTNGVGETTLEDLELEQISNIEIVKGPASGFYGSGLGGVLLFNPVTPMKSGLSQTISMGSFQTLKSTEKLALATRNSGHSVVYSHLHSDGYRQNNESNRNNLTWTSTFTRNHTKIDLLAAFIKMDAFIPSSIDLKTFQETPEKAAANWAATRGYEDYTTVYGGISLRQTLNKNWQTKISSFGHYNKNNELRPFNILQEKNHYQGFRTVVEKKYSSDKTTARFVFGDEFFAENYQWQTLQNNNREAGNLLSDNQEFRRYNNLFLMTDLNFSNELMVSASINLNQTSYTYEDQFLTDGDQSGNHHFNPVVSPRLAASWIMNEQFRLFSVISHGFSPPTLEETLMPNGQRNSSIKPEIGWNFELGAKSTIGKSLYFEVSAYYMKVKNLLVARRTAEDAYLGINAGETVHPGLELKLDYKLIDKPRWSGYFRMNANLTHYRFASFTDNGIDYSGNKLTGTPSATTNWMLETKHSKGFFLNLHFQTVGKMPVLDNNSLFSKAYQLASLMVRYEKTINRFTLGLSSGIQNILDAHYASMILINATAPGNQSPRYYYPGLPRNFKTILAISYSF